MSLTKKDRSFRSSSGNDLPPTGTRSELTFAAGMAAALRRAYGGRHSAVKVVANSVGANERAVRNWFDGKNGPSGKYILRLVHHSDEFLDSFLALAGKKRLTVSHDIERARLILERTVSDLKEFEEGL